MASTAASFGLNGLPNPVEQRIARDRALALAYVNGATVAQIVDRTKINYRTVYRAIKREREWAEAQKESPPADTGRA